MPSKKVKISDAVFEAIEKIAARKNKSVDDMAEEILRNNMSRYQNANDSDR